MTENYTQHAIKDYDNNRHIKSLVKANYVERMHVHETVLKKGKFVNANMQSIEFDESKAKSVAVCHDNIYLHHFTVNRYRFSFFLQFVLLIQ
ncbi:hypothetical protein AADZ84_11155 [Colwelliaceae bacterium MEBiC 14330]